MKKILKSLVPDFYLEYNHKKRVDLLIEEKYNSWRSLMWQKWLDEGSILPPPHAIKQKVIADYKNQYNCKNLIETGTLHGEMIEAQKRSFKKVYSIELDKKLFKEAVDKFKYDLNVKIIHGDSAVKMQDVIKEIKTQSIFWLDGHYSGTYTAKGEVDCPIYGELDCIFSSKIKNHILLIDDARCFTGENSYPKIEELNEYVIKFNKDYSMTVDCDIIRFEVKNK
jgi:hypothetical protein